MKIAVESVEVATLKVDGRWWDGPGRSAIPKAELSAFFALDLDGQLGRLVQLGPAPVPPDLYVRVFVGDQLLIETDEQKTFDAEWPESEAHEIASGAQILVEVWDGDIVFDDLVGTTKLTVPAQVDGGLWLVPPFGQVRRLVLKVA